MINYRFSWISKIFWWNRFEVTFDIKDISRLTRHSRPSQNNIKIVNMIGVWELNVCQYKDQDSKNSNSKFIPENKISSSYFYQSISFTSPTNLTALISLKILQFWVSKNSQTSNFNLNNIAKSFQSQFLKFHCHLTLTNSIL